MKVTKIQPEYLALIVSVLLISVLINSVAEQSAKTEQNLIRILMK